MTTRRSLNQLQTADAVNLLREHFDVAEGKYNGEWNDMAVAKIVRGPEYEDSIKNLRQKFFGTIKRPLTRARDILQSVDQRVTDLSMALNDSMVEVHKQMTEMRNRITELEDTATK